MSLHNVKIGDKAPEIVNAVIEIPKGSHNKYEFDEETGIIKLDRVLYSAMFYPTDYGFIPETRSEDGDHLDVMVYGDNALFPGCALRVRPVGLLRMVDSGEIDFKIIGVQADNSRYESIKDISDIRNANPHFEKEVSHFLERYKDLEGKKTELQGWAGREEALAEIKRAQEMYSSEK
jgi:inorganic pyrophosphatase